MFFVFLVIELVWIYGLYYKTIFFNIALGCFPPPGCSGEFKVKWWKRTPYIDYDNDDTNSHQAVGLFKEILDLIITDICQNCSVIKFDLPSNSSRDVEDDVEKNMTDLGCPMYGSKEQESFRGFPFIPLGTVFNV